MPNTANSSKSLRRPPLKSDETLRIATAAMRRATRKAIAEDLMHGLTPAVEGWKGSPSKKAKPRTQR